MFKRGLDGLVEFIVDKIAERGDQGTRKSDVKPWAEEWYRLCADKGPPSASGRPMPPPLVDTAFINYIWPMVLKDKSLKITARPAATSSATANGHVAGDEQDDQVLVASEERMWIALTGHRVDREKLPDKAFQLLSIIAASGRSGIHQPALVQQSGQDKRSVPERTNKLHKAGYICKKQVTHGGFATSWLVLPKFVPEGQDLAAFDPSVVAPPPPGKKVNKTVTQLAQATMNCLMPTPNNPKPMIIMDDLRQKTGVVSNRTSREALKRTLCFMADLEWIEIWTGMGEGSTNEPDIMAVKLVQQPHHDVWMEFDAACQKYHAETKKSTTEADVDDKESGSASMGTWQPHVPLNRQVFEHLEKVPYPGLDSAQLAQRLGFKFYKKPQEQLTSRMTTHWQAVQPSDLREYTVVRDSTIKYKATTFMYRTAKAHQEAVDAGITSWEAIGRAGDFKSETTVDTDKWGFRKYPAKRLLNTSYAASLSESYKAFANVASNSRMLDKIGKVTEDSANAAQAGFVEELEDDFGEDSTPVPDELGIMETASAIEALAGLKTRLPKFKMWETFIEQAEAFAQQAWAAEEAGSAGSAGSGHMGAGMDHVSDEDAQRIALQTPAANSSADVYPEQPDATMTDVEVVAAKNDTGMVDHSASELRSIKATGKRSAETDHAEGHATKKAKISAPSNATNNGSNDCSNAQQDTQDAQAQKAEAVAKYQLDYLQLKQPRAYLNPPQRLPPTRGRPKKRLLLVIKSDKLRNIPAFSAPSNDSSVVKHVPNALSQSYNYASRRASARQQQLNESRAQNQGIAGSSGEPSNASSQYAVAGPSNQAVFNSPSASRQARGNAKDKGHQSTSEDLRRTGGTIAFQRRELITKILRENSGVYPGGREVAARFAIEWERSHGEKGILPDSTTVEKIVSAMITSGDASRHFFTFQTRNGAAMKKSVLILAGTTDVDARIAYVREQMISKHPKSYLPEIDGSILRVGSQGGSEGSTTSPALAEALRTYARARESNRCRVQPGYGSQKLLMNARAAAEYLDSYDDFRLEKMEELFQEVWDETVDGRKATTSTLKLLTYKHKPLIWNGIGGDSGRIVTLTSSMQTFHAPSGTFATHYSFDDETLQTELAQAPCIDVTHVPELWQTLQDTAPPGQRRPHCSDRLRFLEWWERTHQCNPGPMDTKEQSDFITITVSPGDAPEQLADENDLEEVYGEPRRRSRGSSMRTKPKKQALRVKSRSLPKKKGVQKPGLDAQPVRDRTALKTVVTIELVTLLMGSSIHTLDWARVASILKVKGPEAAKMKALAVFRTKRNLIEAVHAWLPGKFRKMYGSDLPPADPGDYDDYRWDIAVRWFCKQAKKWILPKKPNPARKRPFFTEREHAVFDPDMPEDLPLKSRYLSYRARRGAMKAKSAGALNFPRPDPELEEMQLSKPTSQDLLELQHKNRVRVAKTYIRANNMTDSESYDPAMAQKVLMQFGTASLDQALDEMQSQSRVTRNGKMKDVEGRLFRMNHTWEKPFADHNFRGGFRGTYGDAMRYKHGMDSTFVQNQVLSASKKASRVEQSADSSKKSPSCDHRATAKGKDRAPSTTPESTSAAIDSMIIEDTVPEPTQEPAKSVKMDATRDMWYFMRQGEAMQAVENAMAGEMRVMPDLPASSHHFGDAFDPPKNSAENAATREERMQSLYGFSKTPYKSMHIDQTNMIFPLKEGPAAHYQPGHLPDALHTSTRPPPLYLQGSGRGMMPLWVDLNGAVMPRIWAMSVGAVAHLVAFRAGVTAAGIAALMGPKGLSEAEAEAVLQWLQAEGAARRTRAGWYAAARWVGVVGTSIQGHDDGDDYHPAKRRLPRARWEPYGVPIDERGEPVQSAAGPAKSKSKRKRVAS